MVSSDRLEVDGAVLAALGVTKEQLSKMTLSKFSDLVFDKGYGIEVGGFREAEDGEGKLRVTMASKIGANQPSR